MDPDASSGVFFQLGILLVLTLINAFFSGAEMAVVSVNRAKVRSLAAQGNKSAKLIEKLMLDSTVFLSTIQVAITLAGFFSSAAAATGIAKLLAQKFEFFHVPYAEMLAGILVTIILAYFNLVFGELVPKRIALQKSDTFSLFCVRPIYVLSKIIHPFVKLLSVSTHLVLKIFRMDQTRIEEQVSEEEIKSLIDSGQKSGVFNASEKQMIASVFSFNDKKAREIMVPRQDIVAIDLAKGLAENLDFIFASRRSNIPVYDGRIDNIVGILRVKELMIALRKRPASEIRLEELLKKPYFVQETRRTDSLFREMQREKIKIAILLDEFGGVSGILTLEDLVEEIVGDIQEDYEKEEEDFRDLGKNEYEVSGSLGLFDLNEKLGLGLKSDCFTLSGFLIERLGYIPADKNLPISVETENANFVIEKMDGRVIDKVKLLVRKTAGSENGDD